MTPRGQNYALYVERTLEAVGYTGARLNLGPASVDDVIGNALWRVTRGAAHVSMSRAYCVFAAMGTSPTGNSARFPQGKPAATVSLPNPNSFKCMLGLFVFP